MDHYPEIPTVARREDLPRDPLTGQRDPFARLQLPPIPESYDQRRPPLIPADASVVPGDCQIEVFAIESRLSPDHPWELRPHNEHRGGRSWSMHFGRVNRVAGFWHFGALVFYSADIAHQCAASLTELRRAAQVRFRVVQIRVMLERKVLPGDYCPDQ